MDHIKLLANAYDDHIHPVVITAPDLEQKTTEILYANQAFTAMCGYQPHEYLGKTAAFLQGNKTSQSALKKFICDLKLGKEARTNIINYRKNGEEYWCDIVAWPIYDLHGDLMFYFAFEKEFIKPRGRPRSDRHAEKWWVQ
jgi:PAS domain S-box-containing protein